MIHHLTRATRHLLFWSLVAGAVALTSLRILLMGIDQYKSYLEHRIGEVIGAPVLVGHIGASMHGASPELALKQVRIDTSATGKPAITLDEIRIGVDLLDFLLKRDVLSASWVTVLGAKLNIYRDYRGEFAVEGLDAGQGQPLWLLRGRQYTLLHSRVGFSDHYRDLPPLLLRDVNLALANEGESHRVNVLLDLPSEWGERLALSAELNTPDNKFDQVSGVVFAESENLQLPALFKAFPNEVKVNSGTASVRAWANLSETTFSGLTAELQLQEVGLTNSEGARFNVRNLDSAFALKMLPNGWELDIGKALLTTSSSGKNGKKWPEFRAKLAVEPSQSGSGLDKIRLVSDEIDVAEVSMMTQFLCSCLSPQQKQVLEQARPSGTIQSLTLYAEPHSGVFAVAAAFERMASEAFSTAENGQIPGLKGLSGQLVGTEKTGIIRLDSRNLVLTANRLFSKPLALNLLNGDLAWRQQDAHWQLTGESIRLDTAAFFSESRLEMLLPKSASMPFLDLQTSLSSDDVSKIVAFLPTEAMAETLRAWLKPAFIKGKVPQGSFLFYGNMGDFPFDDKSGIMEADLTLSGIELKYSPDWPHLSGIDGHLFYENKAIIGLFNRGKIGSAEITRTEISIPDLGSRQEQLDVKGELQGEINGILDVLKHSPIAGRVNGFAGGMTIAGSAQGALALTVPLWPGHEIKLDGNANMDGAELTVNSLGLKVNSIKGALRYNMDGIYSDPILAKALGHPIQVNISQNAEQTMIDVEGKASVREVEHLFGWQPVELAEGEGDYRLQLQIPKNIQSEKNFAVTIKSDLAGVNLDLPGHLAKTSTQKTPSTVTVGLGGAGDMPIQVNYNDELKAAVNYDSAARRVRSGHVLIGSGALLNKPSPGIKFEVNKGQLPLQDWIALALSQGQAEEKNFDLDEIEMQSGSALWKKTKLGAFDLTMKKNGEGWSGSIDSSLAKGSFILPANLQGQDPIVMDMDLVKWSALKQFKSQTEQVPTGIKPLLKIDSKKNFWYSANLGSLKLETSRTRQGIDIKRLFLDGVDETIDLSGVWTDHGFNSSTNVKGRLDIKNSEAFFQKLNITRDLTETKGRVNFDLSWRASPWQFDLPGLYGRADINFSGGRILSIEPGFGRVLGILAIGQWLKRLQFDFSDIFEEGLTFNGIQGHFDLKQGKATTRNLTIDAVPAMISLVGDTDLDQRTVDYHIKVIPKSSDAVPIAGTIVGGLADFVGKSLTGKSQEGLFFGREYHVKGLWDNVKISALRENDGLFPKTWSSITDFEWLGRRNGNQE